MASVVPVVSSLFKVNELDTISCIFQVGIIACGASYKVAVLRFPWPSEEGQLRDLVSLHSDHNVIEEHFFNIPLENVRNINYLIS